MSILLLFLPQSIASLLSHAQDRPGQRLLGPLAAPIRTCLSCSDTASRALFLSRFAFPCITAFKTAGRRRNAQASGPIIAIDHSFPSLDLDQRHYTPCSSLACPG